MVQRIHRARKDLINFTEYKECERTCPLSGVKRTWPSAPHMSAFDPKRTLPATRIGRLKFRSIDLEDALCIISEKQGLCFLTESEFVDTFNTFARRPERMVRAEQHPMGLPFAHVVDKVPWIPAHLISRCIDKDVRIFHDKRQHLVEPRHADMATYDTQFRKL